MNKYSKRALKTTATVGMSLAMVLSAAAMPVMATAITETCKTTGTEAECRELFYDLSKAIEKIGLDELTVESTATIAGVEKTGIISSIIINKAGLAAALTGTDYTTFRKWTDVTNTIAGDALATDKATGMFSSEYFTDDAHNATTGGLVNYYDTQLNGAWNTAGLATDASAAVKAYEKMEKWIAEGDYDRLDDTLAARFDVVFNRLETAVDKYISSDETVTNLFVAAWTTVLEQDLTGPSTSKLDFGKKVVDFEKETKLVSGTTLRLDLSDKSAIKARIETIKNAPNYYRVKNVSAVEDIIAQYEDLLGTITDLKDLLKTDAYVAYTKTKTDNADATLKSVLTGFTKDAKSLKDNAKRLAATLDIEQYEILLALKEDVLDNAYTFETKKVGNYYVDKSAIASGFTMDATVKRDLGTDAYDVLLGLVDTKEGLFGIDVVLNHLADFEKAYAAATTDIAKLTPANIKSSDKAKLEAAEDAYFEMTDGTDGKYTKNLTKDQKKELRRVKTTVENLRESFDNLGTTEVAGWYDMGNGNWGYNNEDGTPAAYKWVASGSNWYFVRDGKMARNTWLAANSTDWYYLGSDGKMATSVSVDGCWINSLGIYTK